MNPVCCICGLFWKLQRELPATWVQVYPEAAHWTNFGCNTQAGIYHNNILILPGTIATGEAVGDRVRTRPCCCRVEDGTCYARSTVGAIGRRGWAQGKGCRSYIGIP